MEREIKGFKIICLNCGKEKIIQSGNFYDGPILIEPIGRDGDIDISCECCINEVNN